MTDQESIFKSSLRTFVRLLLGTFALFLGLFLAVSIFSFFGSTPDIPIKTDIEILPDANFELTFQGIRAPVILEIPIHGVIGDPNGVNTESIQEILLHSRLGLLEKDRVKGILLHMQTPGGTVIDSSNIYHMLLDYKKKYNVPIFAYIDGLCASGGMYIASAADQIFAGPSSIIGSVGVILGPFFNIYEGMTKLGVLSKTLTKGIDKDAMSPTRPWKEGEDASLQVIMNYFYEEFVDIVTQHRPRLDRNQLVNEYGAQVFDCVRAQRYGYVDVAPSSRSEALQKLVEISIGGKPIYQVVALAHRNSVFASLFKSSWGLLRGRIEHTIDLGQPPIREKFSYLYQPF
jgi:signal peptide peptidase SppA